MIVILLPDGRYSMARFEEPGLEVLCEKMNRVPPNVFDVILPVVKDVQFAPADERDAPKIETDHVFVNLRISFVNGKHGIRAGFYDGWWFVSNIG